MKIKCEIVQENPARPLSIVWSSLLLSTLILFPACAQTPLQENDPLPLILEDKIAYGETLTIDTNPATDMTEAEIAAREQAILDNIRRTEEREAARAAGQCDRDVETPPEICAYRSIDYTLNGFAIPRSAAPFQVQFLINERGVSRERLSRLLPDFPEWEARHACGGAMIAPGWALTAAHCFALKAQDGSISIEKHKYSARLDVENIARDQSTPVEIEEIILHPEYSLANNQNDLALVRLKMPGNDTLPWYNGTKATDEIRLHNARLHEGKIHVERQFDDVYIIDPRTNRIYLSGADLPSAPPSFSSPLAISTDENRRIIADSLDGANTWRLGRTRLDNPYVRQNETGTRLFLIDVQGQAEIWDIDRRKRLARFTSELSAPDSLFSRDDGTVLLWSSDGESEFRNAQTGELIAAINHSLPISSAKHAADDLAIIEGRLGTVDVINMKNGEIVHRIFHGGGDVYTSLEGYTLLTFSVDGRFRLFDLEQGREVFHALLPHQLPEADQETQILSRPEAPVKIQRVALSAYDPEPRESGPLTAFGWGKTRATDQERSSALLRKVSLNRIGWVECNAHRGMDMTATDPSSFCVIGRGRKTCRGDSGGPLLEHARLVGVVSRGSGLCWSDDRPTLFTSVAKARPWIISEICSPDRPEWHDPALCNEDF